MPKVSICVPVFNVEKYIERCVRSICSQTLDDIEIIFINDCTPDRSWEILKTTIADYTGRESQIRLLENHSNSGPGISRQRCAQVATGEYIYFCDSDDWLEPEMLETMYDAALRHDADIVGCQVNIIPRTGTPFPSSYRTNFTKEQWVSNIIMMPDLTISIALWTRLIRKSIYDKTFVDEERLHGLVRFEDFLNVVKCHYYSDRIHWLQQPLYNHDWSNMGSVTKTNNAQAVESCIRMASALEQFFTEKNITAYKREIDHFKASAKNQLIMSTGLYDPQRWRLMWPELNNYPNVSRKAKIAMRLAAGKHDQFLQLCNKTFRAIQAITHR